MSLVAQATVSRLVVYDSPKTRRVLRVLANPWVIDPQAPSATVPQVFLVRAQRGDWLKILLPVRPNGSVGWIRRSAVALREVEYHIRVELASRRLTVFEGSERIYAGPVAVGAPATPTPNGRYYLRVLMQAPDPNSVYGPYAYGLSSHSDVLTTFAGGDAEIGIHGNNDVSSLGQAVTHGCVRMDNAEISRLANILPLGTPVQIQR
jgi:lipoprotein-anchoring transpeptidase ErfK/SrfK